MHPKGFEQFQQTRAETVRMAREISTEECAKRPSANQWSPGEILDHLILSEKLHRGSFAEMIELDRAGKRPVIYRTLSELDTSVFGFPKELLPLVSIPLMTFNLFVPAGVREYFVRNRILPANNPKASEPAPDRPLAGLVADLEQSIRETEALFAANPDANYRRMRICHPMLGNNDVTGLLRILDFHERRHQEQFREVLASLRARGPVGAALASSAR